MAVLIRPKRWGQAPPMGGTLNGGHPHAQGLEVAAIAWAGGGHPQEIVRSRVGGTANAMPTWKPQGIFYSSSSSTGSQWSDIPDAPLITDRGISLVFGGSI